MDDMIVRRCEYVESPKRWIGRGRCIYSDMGGYLLRKLINEIISTAVDEINVLITRAKSSSSNVVFLRPFSVVAQEPQPLE